MDVVFFGGYDPEYPRNAVLRRGLEINGVRVSECRVWPLRRFWRRYPALVRRWLGLPKRPASPLRFLFVPEFAQVRGHRGRGGPPLPPSLAGSAFPVPP